MHKYYGEHHDPANNVFHIHNHPVVRVVTYHSEGGVFSLMLGSEPGILRCRIVYHPRSAGTPEIELLHHTYGTDGLVKALQVVEAHEDQILRCLRMALAKRIEEAQAEVAKLSSYLGAIPTV